ncbi:SH3 domain-containing protein [Methylocella sp.]|uniref:SH3 domain-containing protein n=1 Tax=Methylocella sp. TaxID=1978226 RepID=UPI003784FEC6
MAQRSKARVGRRRPRGWRALALLLVALGLAPAAAEPAGAPGQPVGTVSGLPIPRYVSLKSDRVNLREGPSKEHRTSWVFLRAGLPVEITAEFDVWRKVRDSEGSEGWVLHSLLSGRRTGLVTPWKKAPEARVYDAPGGRGATVAALQPNVIANVKSCDGEWCRVWGEGFKGYVAQRDLWGVYPGEKFD